MVAIINPSFRVSNAKSFKESLLEPTYLAVGRIVPWVPTDISPTANDLNPPTPGTSGQYTYDTYNSLIGAKRVSPADCVQGVKRNDWKTGTIYDEYDYRDHELNNKKFFVIINDGSSADHLNVYKCISNNGGIASTAIPIGNSLTNITTADGYIWKFMAKLNPIVFAKFATSKFIPMKDAVVGDGSLQYVVQTTAVAGTIDSIKIINGGTGYSAATVTITGDGTGAAATAVISGGIITKIVMSNIGSGYTYASVTITGNGDDATAYANLAPANGHGSSALNELFAYYAMVDVALEYDEEGTISTENDVRSIVIIQNPSAQDDSPFATSRARLTTKLTYTGLIGTLEIDEILTDDTTSAYGRIVEFDATYVYLTDTVGAFGGNPFTTSISASTGVVTAIDLPDFKIGTGQMLYVENRRPIQRDLSQVERYSIVFEW